MRLALISDIHGNLLALDEVLKDIEKSEVDQIICLGDITLFGPQPRETVQRIKEIGCPVVMGNSDVETLDPGERLNPENEDKRKQEDVGFWGIEQLTETELDFIRTFKPTIEVALDGEHKLLCFHGSPRSNTEVIIATTPDDELAPMIAGHDALIFAGGHTHAQLFRRFHGRIILNPGSVGLPVERIPGDNTNPLRADHALITAENNALHFDLRSVPIDGNALRDVAFSSGMPHPEWWIADWR